MISGGIVIISIYDHTGTVHILICFCSELLMDIIIHFSFQIPLFIFIINLYSGCKFEWK